jgi:hypothetical protein
MLIREKMDNGGTEGGSVSDAVLECPAVYATRIGFLEMCFLGTCWCAVVVFN